MDSESWTNYGPLTSIFAPRDDCTTIMVSSATPTPVSNTETLFMPTPVVTPRLVVFDPRLEPTCFPTQYPKAPQITTPPTTFDSTDDSSSSSFYTRGYFSPGRCPESWATRTLTGSMVPPNNTLALCCPQPYTRSAVLSQGRGHVKHIFNTDCLGFFTYEYSTTATITPTITAISSGSVITMVPEQWYSIAGTKNGKVIHATGINVMWKKGDFPDIDALPVSTATATPTAKAGNDADWETQPHGLAMGTKIAIGASTASAVLLIAVFGFIFWHIRRTMKTVRKSVGFATGIQAGHRSRSDSVDSDSGQQHERGGLLFIQKTTVSGQVHVQSIHLTTAAPTSQGPDDISFAPRPAQDDIAEKEPPPPYVPPESTSAGASNTVPSTESDLEYAERRLRERRQMLDEERRQLARDEETLRARQDRM